MGLESLSNFGDNFILQCNRFLIEELGIYNTKIADFEPSMSKTKSVIYYFILLASKICCFKTLRYKLIVLAVKLRCWGIYEEWLQASDAVVLGCGSIKYGTQKLWVYYSLIIEIANKLNIPVMFNSMNIQKYNGEDWRCRFLQSHINSECVKVITSRDGEAGAERLRKDYKINDNILSAGVGDVAFWIPECYKTQRKQTSATVGINLIYGNIFRRYGNSLTEKELLHVYVDLLHQLDQADIQWELFTNGLSSDYKFGIKLLRLYGNTQRKIKVPKSDVDLINMIIGYTAILGARLHACICAYSLGIPFVGFIWDEKLYYFAKMAHIEQHFVNETELSGDLLYEKIIGKDSSYNSEQFDLRDIWKTRTKEYLNSFLKKI